jgi:hypothetical protein
VIYFLQLFIEHGSNAEKRREVDRFIRIIAKGGITAYTSFIRYLVRCGHFDVVRFLEPQLDIYYTFEDLS